MLSTKEVIKGLAEDISTALSSFRRASEPLLSELESLRKSTVIPFFIGTTRGLSNATTDTLYNTLLDLGLPLQNSVDILLFSEGGDATQAYLIGTVLQDNVKGKLTFVIPRYAKSAATLLACAGDEIAMGSPSELGPVQLVVRTGGGSWISARSIVDTLRMLSNQGIKGDVITEIVRLREMPLAALGDLDKSMEYTKLLVERILQRRMFKDDPTRAREVAEALTEVEVHDASITRADAAELGLKVVDLQADQWKLVWGVHVQWTKVLRAEGLLPPPDRLAELGFRLEPLDYKVGKGIALSATPVLRE